MGWGISLTGTVHPEVGDSHLVLEQMLSHYEPKHTVSEL